jgi:hypothetical protein
MFKQKRYLRNCPWAAGALATIVAPGLWAQYAPPPTSYSVTAINSMFGGPVTMQIYRDGDLVIVDHPDHHIRSLYNLKNNRNIGWDTQHPENGCSNGTFSGDWGDPFVASDLEELLKSSTKAPASDTVNGVATKVFEATDPQSKIHIKVWRDPKYGMVMKGEMTPPGGATTTILAVKQFSFAKPSASLFVIPPACANAPPPPPPPPTPAQRFATETGDDGANFVDATTGPGSPNSCTMLMRFVKAGSMQPLSDFQVALDLAFDPIHAPSYNMGGSPSGRTVFSGGHLKEYTAQIQNGVLRIDNVPAVFDFEMTFAGGNQGASSAMLYRKCSGPQTVLLYVVKNPDKVSDGGDWIWVKSGKFAAVLAH